MELLVFSYGGLGMAAQEYTTSRTESSNREINTRSMVKTNTAIAMTKAIQEIAVFKCESVTLDKDAVNMARDIGKGKTQEEKELMALKFLNVYPAEINMGPFGIGGWFEYTATTTSSEMKTLDTMQQEAASQSANKLTAAIKIFAVVAAGQAGLSKGDEVQVSSGVADTRKVENGTFTSTFEYSCAGPTVYDMNELNKNLNNPDNWSIFPSIAVGNHRFKRVDSILESLAAESSDVDEELINAAEIIRQIIDNATKLVVREPLIPKDASMTALERVKQIDVLQQRLQEINQYKEQVKRMSENKDDLQENLRQIQAALKTDIEFNCKEEALNALDMLKISTEILKFYLTKIDFTSINLKTRCEKLMEVCGLHGFHYKLQQPIISASAKEVGIVGFAYGGIGMAVQGYTSSKTESSSVEINTRSKVKN